MRKLSNFTSKENNMALTFEQYQKLRKQGLSNDQIRRFESGEKPQTEPGGVMGAIKRGVTGIKEDFGKRTNKNADILVSEQSTPSKVAQVAGQNVGFFADIARRGGGTVISALTPDRIEKPIVAGAKKVAEKIAGSAPVQVATREYGRFKENNPEAAGNVEAAGNFLDLATTGFGVGSGAKVAGKEAVNVVSDAAQVARQQALRSLPEKAQKAVGQIIQGKSKDITPALRVLSKIETKGVQTYNQLSSAVGNNIKALSHAMDELLSADPKPRVLSELDKVVKVGEQEVRTNYVGQALQHLEELYTKTNDPVAAQKIKNLSAKASQEGLTVKEINDVAKEYGVEFGSKAFNTVGDPRTSINSVAYENTRKGVKDTLRSLLPDDKAKLIDKELSDHINTQELIKKMTEKVNALSQKAKERGILEKTAIGTAKAVDTLTGHSLRGLLSGLLPSNVGLKTMNSLNLQEVLKKNLAIIQKAEKALESPNFTPKSFLGRIAKLTKGMPVGMSIQDVSRGMQVKTADLKTKLNEFVNDSGSAKLSSEAIDWLGKIEKRAGQDVLSGAESFLEKISRVKDNNKFDREMFTRIAKQTHFDEFKKTLENSTSNIAKKLLEDEKRLKQFFIDSKK